MSESLSKFGTVNICAACGYEPRLSVCQNRFDTAFCEVWLPSKDSRTTRDASYIERTCPKCGYTWRELPLYLVDK